MEDIAKKFFDKSINEKERAIFELGIALGFVYHQFLGLPFRRKNKKYIEKAVEEAILSQPFRIYANVKLKAKSKKEDTYSYDEISRDNIDVIIKVKYGKIIATGRLRFIKELNYPLMYIEKIE